jgi:gliding motility-associated-like protein
VASSTLPGFQLSSSGQQVYYKPWTTNSLNLSGLAGHTVIIDFSSGDCGQGAHFGYGYIDMSCGLFQITASNCAGTSSYTTLSGPPGFQTYTWMDSTYSTVIGTGQSITIPVPAVNTKYNLVLTPYTGFGCPDTLSTRILLSSLTLTATPDTVVCKGAFLQLSAWASSNALPVAYLWAGPPGLSCSSCTSPTLTANASGSYVVTVTDQVGCFEKDTVNVGVSPQVTLTKQDVSCSGASTGSATLTPAGTVSGSSYSYSWNTTPVQTTASITGLVAGTYTATVTDTQRGCSLTVPVTITQPATPVVLNTTKSNVTCFGLNNGIISTSVTGGVPPYSYAWTGAANGTANGLYNLPAGTYNLNVTDLKGCIISTSVIITQPAQLTATMVKVRNVKCFGMANGKAYVVVVGGTFPYTYQWTGGAGTSDTATNLNAGTYTVNITDAKGCTTSASVTITQPQALSVSTTASSINCFGAANGSIASVVVGGTLPYSLAWNTVPVQSTGTISNLTPGTYTITVTDSQGCTASSTKSVSQPLAPLSLSVVSTKDVSCNGAADGSATLSLSGGTAPYSSTWNTVPTLSGLNQTALSGGTYKVVVVDAKGCSDSVLVIINEPAPLAISAADLTKSCSELSTGSAQATATGGTTPYTWQWNSVPVQTTPNLLGVSPGIYTVIVWDSKGCSGTATIPVGTFAKPDVAIGRDTLVCGKSSIRLHAIGAATYSWTPTFGLSCAACDTPLASFVGTRTFTVIGLSAAGCPDTATITIGMYTRTPVAVGPTLDLCKGQGAKLLAAGGVSYHWTPPAGLDDPDIAQPAVQVDTDTRYTVVITENPCFKDTLYQQVHIHSIPVVDAGADFQVLPGAQVTLLVRTDDANSVAWTPAENVACPSCPQTTALLSGKTTYTVTATSPWGCKASDEVTVNAACDGSVFYFPNTFTPNGDGDNDMFYPQGLGLKVVSLFRIYSRWGEVIFNAENIPANSPEAGWDGSFRGQQLKPDVYVYVAVTRCADGQAVEVKGDISLIR